jgi:hypothetical protein
MLKNNHQDKHQERKLTDAFPLQKTEHTPKRIFWLPKWKNKWLHFLKFEVLCLFFYTLLAAAYHKLGCL